MDQAMLLFEITQFGYMIFFQDNMGSNIVKISELQNLNCKTGKSINAIT